MSLFPAYSLHGVGEGDKVNSDELTWLQNESCPEEISVVADQSKKERADRRDTDGETHGILASEQFSLEKQPNYEVNFSEHKKLHKSHSGHKNKKSKSHHLKKLPKISFPVKNLNSKGIFLGSHPITRLLPEDVIYLDFLGDRNNCIFSTTHYSQLAKYTFKKCRLGHIASMSKKNKAKRYFNKKIQLLFLKPAPTVVATSSFESVQDRSFISMNDSNKSDNSEVLNQEVSEIIETRFDNLELSYWQLRVKEFNEYLNKNPNDISMWLKYTQFQDRLMDEWLEAENRSKRRTSLVQINDKKIAILDVAILKNEKSISLYFERLVVGQEIWSQEQLTDEWNALVNKFPNDVKVWQQFLIFNETYFPTFNLDAANRSHIRYLNAILKMDPSAISRSNSYLLTDNVTNVAQLWKQGGHMERAISLFQALIELNLCCPLQLKKMSISKQEVLNIFEVFWDSKAPRFGEKESIGWGAFLDKRENVTFPEEILGGTRDEEDEILSKRGEKAQLWVHLEFSRELNHWLPWQQDPDLCEDMERIVAFSDIEKHLFLVTSEEEAFYLVLNFLIFLGVSVPHYIVEDTQMEFLRSPMFPLRLETLQEFLLEEEKDTAEGMTDNEDLFHFPVIAPSLGKLPCKSYFEFICRILERSIELFPTQYRVKFVLILIKLLSERATMERLEGLWESPKIYKKKIKNVLKQEEFRNNIEIFYEFANFENSLGFHEEALKIHSLSLTLGLQSKGPFANDSLFLLRHLMSALKLELLLELDLKDSHYSNIIQNQICSIVLENRYSGDHTQPNGAWLLKAKRKLSYLKENSISNTKFNPLVASSIVAMLAFLQFLVAGFSQACLIFEDSITKVNGILSGDEDALENFERLKEFIYEHYIWFIHVAPKFRHIDATLPMSPAQVRSVLHSAVKAGPFNVYILSRLSHSECQMWRNISKIKDGSSEGASILVTIFQLMPHIRRVNHALREQTYDVLSYQLLSVLESAVMTMSGRHCPLLWRLYLRLTHRVNPKAFKALVYRAIDNCPHAKCVYLDCVMLGPESLSEILKVMTEKGMRVRLPLEELDVLLENEEEESDNHPEEEIDNHPEEESDNHPEEESDNHPEEEVESDRNEDDTHAEDMHDDLKQDVCQENYVESM